MTTFGGTGGSEGEIRKPGCGVDLGVERSLPEGPVASLSGQSYYR